MVWRPCSLEILPCLAGKSYASVALRRLIGLDKATKKFDIAGQCAGQISALKEMIWTLIGEEGHDFLALI